MGESGRVIAGALVTLPLGGRRRPLDGFWVRAPRPARPRRLLVYVHGMHSDFYRSELKKRFMTEAPRRGHDLLLFNNRGSGEGVADERFADARADLAAALAFGRRHGYRRVVLLGHSTGCQKVVHFQALERAPGVEGLVLLGPADDYAICRRELGRRYADWLRRARRLVAEGRGAERLPPGPTQGFSARRFLSVADPASTEAKIFDYAGRLTHFRRVQVPMLVLFGAREEYACRPLGEMGAILREATRSRDFRFGLVPGADHGFHGRERETAGRVLDWIDGLPARRPRRPVRG